MWHAYNLIREGDAVTATTFRKVQKDSGGTSAVASERIKIKLTIKVEEVDFDAEGATCFENMKPRDPHCAQQHTNAVQSVPTASTPNCWVLPCTCLAPDFVF